MKERWPKYHSWTYDFSILKDVGKKVNFNWILIIIILSFCFFFFLQRFNTVKKLHSFFLNFKQPANIIRKEMNEKIEEFSL